MSTIYVVGAIERRVRIARALGLAGHVVVGRDRGLPPGVRPHVVIAALDAGERVDPQLSAAHRVVEARPDTPLAALVTAVRPPKRVRRRR